MSTNTLLQDRKEVEKITFKKENYIDESTEKLMCEGRTLLKEGKRTQWNIQNMK